MTGFTVRIMEEQKNIIKEVIASASSVNLPGLEVNSGYSSFVGIPGRSHSDPAKVLIFPELYTDTGEYLEFFIKDICHIEELETISSPEGKSAVKARVWVKKGVRAVKARPFTVE